MLRYTPPKSSMWGHSTYRKTPENFRKEVVDFLNEATETRKQFAGSLTIAAGDEFIESFCTEVGVAASRLNGNGTISDSEFNRCLDWITAHPEKISSLNNMQWLFETTNRI